MNLLMPTLLIVLPLVLCLKKIYNLLMFTSNAASDKKYYNSLLPDPIKHTGSNLLHVSSDKKSCELGQSVLAYK